MNCIHCAKKFCESDILGHLRTFVECTAFDKTIESCYCGKDCCEYEEESDDE